MFVITVEMSNDHNYCNFVFFSLLFNIFTVISENLYVTDRIEELELLIRIIYSEIINVKYSKRQIRWGIL